MNLNEIALPSTQFLTEAFSGHTEGFSLNDLIYITHTYIAEAKNNKPRSMPSAANDPKSEVVFKEMPSWAATASEKLKHMPALQDKIEAFKATKLADRMQPFGASDTAFVGGGPISSIMPGLRHAHITRDLSIIYTLSGSRPTVISLYGIFSHADTGTGTPANPNRQKSFAKALKNQ